MGGNIVVFRILVFDIVLISIVSVLADVLIEMGE